MGPMTESWVLDSYAVLALLQEEPGSDEVLQRLEQAQRGEARVLMTWVNVGEVVYIVERERGKSMVHRVLGMLEATALEIVDAGRDLTLLAAEIKAKHPLAYADAFAAALAIQERAILITGDPELRQMEGRVRIHWLPQAS